MELTLVCPRCAASDISVYVVHGSLITENNKLYLLQNCCGDYWEDVYIPLRIVNGCICEGNNEFVLYDLTVDEGECCECEKVDKLVNFIQVK